jgi:abortive infection bacteriophage resistance protein
VKYCKPPFNYEQQADQLLARGMAGDRDQIIRRLSQVSYYRLSGYWYPFRQLDPNDPSNVLDDFKPNTTFDAVWSRYVFDRQLRLLVLDAIERIEVAVRSQLAFHHSHEFGLFDYATDPTTLPGCNSHYRTTFLHNLEVEVNRSKDAFVKHFFTKYGDTHRYLPVWMAVEIMAFGSVLTFYSGSPHKIKKAIAATFDMPARVFATWLLTLNTVRNICAHHARLWNREIGTAPMIPRQKDYPDWHQPKPMRANRLFATLTICKWSLDRIAPQSQWADRLRALLAGSPDIPIASMGFPADWTQCPIWTPPATAVQGTP